MGSGHGHVDEKGNPIDDDDGDDDSDIIEVNANVGNANAGNKNGSKNNDKDHDDKSDKDHDDKSNKDDDKNLINFGSHAELNENKGEDAKSDKSVSTGAVVAIVLVSLFLIAVILIALGTVYFGYKRRRPTFIVTQKHPKILVATTKSTATTSIPKSYMQSPRFSPKDYEAIPVTDYVPVQPDIKKPVY